MSDGELAAISDLIGAIYDCAIDPALWPETLGGLCALLDGVASQLYVVDFDTGTHHFATGWGEAPEATRALVARYQGPSADWQRGAILRRGPDADPDEPIVLRREPNAEEIVSSAFFQGWADVLGYVDMIGALVLRRDSRAGLVGVARHRDVGIVTDREVRLMRLLAPHLRRAVAIGDMLDMARLEAEALKGAVDGLSVGIGLVSADGTVLHANRAAAAMMASGEGPIRAVGGRLAARRPGAAEELASAIAMAGRSDAALGGAGIGVVLREAGADGAPSVAHVLPLAGGEARQRIGQGAAAAVFVSPAAAPGGLDTAFASLGLTAAEARLAARLAAGETLAEASSALGIAETTAKTHLARIFGKAGVSRQAELVALLERLRSPSRGG
jgi:DNA-binding CsgD family transcriptional regulator/PAS domain-containing protein